MTAVVLIIEDNDKNLRLARDVLQFHGFETLEATTASAGIALAERHAPDVILMDIQLPDVTGVEALARLRASAATAAIPVVALTAFVMRHDREQLMAAGFNGYLAKPIDTYSFAESVRAYCEARL